MAVTNQVEAELVMRPARTGGVVAVLALAGMCASFTQTILIPIQGELPQLLNASSGDTAWVITITLLVAAICTPISGKLGDMYGKRRVALCLLGVLASGSVVAALSPTVVPLIVGRGLQGMGMGVIPLGIAILRDTLPADRLGSAIALVSATLGVGGALGLPISALVTEHFDWHMLFWLAAGLSVATFALMASIVPESALRAGGRVDVVGVVGLAVGLSGVLLAISRGNDWGWTSSRTLGLLIGGILVLLVWGWLELRIREPLVDLRVSASGPVLLTNLASIAMGFALFSSQIAFPQLLELPTEAGGLGRSLLQASVILMPAGLAMLAMSPVSGRLERRWGPKPLLVAGAAVIAAGYTIAVLSDLQVWHILLINVFIGVGIGLGYAAMPTLIIRAVPESETGAANGLNTLMRSLGTATAAAVIAVVLARSTVEVGGTPVPSADGFQVAFFFGLGAAILCTAIAVFIPKPEPRIS
ncbi:MFS transporter [Mycobacterium sp. 236(2023)]|uniref:MFS transporter n=1 Tax=Mycobacterium sp. 236(2023) TaxID=3038163 RepID=UPI00241537AB|nr:MFS transporter [Mycobacterium sp. 236(2023)]MDG4664434.1 MFS transporter [Mycobacterium sp. 236(2023)]